MMKKQAVELSINFFVIIMISLVVFAIGLVFLRKIIFNTEPLIFNINQEIDKKLRNMLMGNQRVAVYPSMIELHRGKKQIIGVGILNTDALKTQFILNVRCKSFVHLDGVEVACPANALNIVYDSSNFEVKNNKKVTMGVAVQVERGAEKGTYLLEVTACSSNVITSCSGSSDPNMYYNPQILSVVVQ